MTSVPTITTPATAHDLTQPEALRQLVTRLFEAGNADALTTACQAFADVCAAGSRLHWHPREAAQHIADDASARILAHHGDNGRVLVLRYSCGVDADHGVPWEWISHLAQHRLDHLADMESLFGTVSRLAQAERLQRALYTIADLVVASQDNTATMQAIHRTIGTLMYAENFYVVLHDHEHDTIRFPYFADNADGDGPDPQLVEPLEAIRHTITWYLIREGRSFMGNPETLAGQVDGPLLGRGPECADWLGVPMRHNDHVTGALVVQTYDPQARYTEQDRELLTYVAQHLQTALGRRQATVELEQRVDQRTHALRGANRVLQQQVLERQRGERLQASLFRIAELANTTESLDTFYASIHRVIGSLIYARNFYIALVNEQDNLLEFPYSVDQVDRKRDPRKQGRGTTEYVLRHGKPLLVGPKERQRLIDEGEIAPSGAPSECWLGVPLIWDVKVMGVLAVQSYAREHIYGPRDQELLTFVSYHIANALQRRRDTESLKLAYTDMERRVAERTRALALANRDLRKQVADRERAERRLKYETLHDPLTGLPNRALLLQRLEVAMQHHRDDPARLFAVLFIDLDRFKVINDSVGHLIGDDLLFQVGGRIRSCLKSRDTVARMGGDEFAVLLESIRHEDAAQTVATRIIESLNQPFRVGVKELFTSASIGISLASAAYRRTEELLRDADSAMYSAKGGGRHRAETFDDRLRHQAIEVLEIENDLRRGLTRHEFVPYYQPVVDMADGHTVGYEALLRWRHPERGVLLPADFLHVAEDSGCVEDIDWQIFEQACRAIPQLTGGDGGGVVSINVSARHFRSSNLEHRLMALLERHHAPPECLRLEVTEGTLLEHPIEVKRTLQAFRDHGMRIALDDFGTGYSSLSYMHQYPIEVLKIDQSFVVNLDESGQSQGNVVVRAILALASSLGIRVIAEGIETPLQERVLKQMGCRYAQGFLYARAHPIETYLPDAARHAADASVEDTAATASDSSAT